jgi:hypothetical protein
MAATAAAHRARTRTFHHSGHPEAVGDGMVV